MTPLVSRNSPREMQMAVGVFERQAAEGRGRAGLQTRNAF